ncbi:MAG: hypothetical protein FWG65_01930 [Turicibacter sp.]|nr:hypothetical protein [Turicibacter sp.]
MLHTFDHFKIGLDPQFYEGFNHVVKLFWRTYLDFKRREMARNTHDEDIVTSIYDLDSDFLPNFVSLGVKLMGTTMHLWAIEILLTNAREAFLLKCKPNERDLLGLQTLWVIRAIMLAKLVGIEEIHGFAQHFVSQDFEMSNFLADMYKTIQNEKFF